MLETTLVSLQDIALDKIFDDSGRKALFLEFAKIMQEVTTCTFCLSIFWFWLNWFKPLSGICLLTWWHLHVNNGAACLVRTSHRVEGLCGRRELLRPLPCSLFCQLVIHLNLSISISQKKLNMGETKSFDIYFCFFANLQCSKLWCIFSSTLDTLMYWWNPFFC